MGSCCLKTGSNVPPRGGQAVCYSPHLFTKPPQRPPLLSELRTGKCLRCLFPSILKMVNLDHFEDIRKLASKVVFRQPKN